MWAWLAIPWVRKLGEIVLLLAAIGAVIHWIYHAGKLSGQQSEASRQTEQNKAQFEQIKATFQQQLDAGNAREQRLADQASRFADLAATASNRVVVAQQASATDASKIKVLPDSAIKADIELKLGGPLENPAVLRHADEIVTDYPHKVEEAHGAGAQIVALQSSLTTAQAQTTNAQQERDAAITAFNGLLPLYTQAYDAAIQGHRHWYCLWLCKPKKRLALPAPVTLSSLNQKRQ